MIMLHKFLFFTGFESDLGVLSQIMNSKVKLCRENVKAPSCKHSKSSEVRKSGNLLLLLDYLFQLEKMLPAGN